MFRGWNPLLISYAEVALNLEPGSVSSAVIWKQLVFFNFDFHEKTIKYLKALTSSLKHGTFHSHSIPIPLGIEYMTGKKWLYQAQFPNIVNSSQYRC